MTELEVPKIFTPIVRGVEILKDTNINSMVIKGPQGIGKSFWVDYAVQKAKCNYVLFKGSVSEARFYEFISDNSDKVIIMRDCGNLLRNLVFLDFLKSATDTTPKREISRLNYANHQVESTILFEGKIIWEINSLTDKNKDDLIAVLDRSIYVELNFSVDEIKEIMFQICIDDGEKEVTKYLIENIEKIGTNNFNFRTQVKLIQIYKDCISKKLDWKKEIDNFIKNEQSECRKMVYRLVGNNQIKRMELVRYLMRSKGWGYAKSQRSINEWLYLDELYSNGLQKQAMLSLNRI